MIAITWGLVLHIRKTKFIYNTAFIMLKRISFLRSRQVTLWNYFLEAYVGGDLRFISAELFTLFNNEIKLFCFRFPPARSELY